MIKNTSFHASNSEDFSKAVSLGTIRKKVESCYNTLTVRDKGKYKYVRYITTKNRDAFLAEVEFYDTDGNLIPVMRTYGKRGEKDNDEISKMFDGKVLTYCNLPHVDGRWAAVEFDKPACVSEIRFLPRNDGNFIEESDMYELCFWNGNNWEPIKRLDGNSDGVLHIDGVPDNALLLLRDLTKGREERIFTYDVVSDKQIWW